MLKKTLAPIVLLTFFVLPALAQQWKQKYPAASPPAIVWGALAYDAAHSQVVLFGGLDASGFNTGTWVWDGSNWTQRTPATTPPPRVGAGFSAAPGGGVLLFGGQNYYGGTLLGDTWLWDGTTWTQITLSNSPSARNNPAMAYDSQRNRVVLFGGHGCMNICGDTWEWDGTTWTQVATSGPTSVSGASLAYDAAHGRMVLFGGDWEMDGPTPLYNTWVWDGSTWTDKTDYNNVNNNPPERAHASMAYDAAAGRVVLFGGEDDASRLYLGDTWTWDGTAWQQRTVTPAPPVRTKAGMAYDDARQQVVLFGGIAWGDDLFDDTWVYTAGRAYSALVQQPINPDGSSVFNASRGVVPVKFTLTANGLSTCTLPPATIAVSRTAGSGTIGTIDESVYTQAADSGSNFRIDQPNCQYVYNLAARALGVGAYQVNILISNAVVGTAKFALK